MMKYSLGFAFDEMAQNVLLIRKSRPAWQIGLLNGVGGKLEGGESYPRCMSREFLEETGIEVEELLWKPFAKLYGPEFEMTVFSLFANQVALAKSLTDEPVNLIRVSTYKNYPHIANLEWLIPAALESRDYCNFMIRADYKP